VGCHQSPYDIARSDSEALRSRADTLLFLVSVAEPVSPTRETADAVPSLGDGERDRTSLTRRRWPRGYLCEKVTNYYRYL
jgi:hypothetical protein